MFRADPPSGPATDPETGDPLYAYKPSLAAAPCQFRLRPDALEWRTGRRSGLIAYDRARRVRLSFRPVNLAAARFVAEVWDADGARIVIASTSWKSIAEQEPLDAAYRAFITELHRRILAAGGTAAFEAGSPVWLYWPGVAVFAATALVLAALTVVALASGQISGALFVAGFLALFLWRLGGYFARNRPGIYRPDALPAALIPRA